MNIEMSNDINIYNVDDVVIDNNRNNIRVEITHLKGIDYEYDLYSDGSYYFYKNTSPASFFKIIINDIKNKKIRNYDDAFNIKIKIYISYDNYKKLNSNHYGTFYENK